MFFQAKVSTIARFPLPSMTAMVEFTLLISIIQQIFWCTRYHWYILMHNWSNLDKNLSVQGKIHPRKIVPPKRILFWFFFFFFFFLILMEAFVVCNEICFHSVYFYFMINDNSFTLYFLLFFSYTQVYFWQRKKVLFVYFFDP